MIPWCHVTWPPSLPQAFWVVFSIFTSIFPQFGLMLGGRWKDWLVIFGSSRTLIFRFSDIQSVPVLFPKKGHSHNWPGWMRQAPTPCTWGRCSRLAPTASQNPCLLSPRCLPPALACYPFSLLQFFFWNLRLRHMIVLLHYFFTLFFIVLFPWPFIPLYPLPILLYS